MTTILCIETEEPFRVIRTMEEHSARLLAMSCGEKSALTFRLFYAWEQENKGD